MNPWNVGFLVIAWTLAIVAGVGFYFGEPGVALPALVFNTAVLTAVLAGSDRADRTGGYGWGGERE